jgi:hypothetical protein
MTHLRAAFEAITLLLLASRVAGTQAAAPYSLYGSSDLDMAGCSQAGPIGNLSPTFWVIRRWDIAGPTNVIITNMPPNVTATVSPAQLTYPGWVIGQQVTVALTVNAGVAIPDVVVHITANDGANSVSYDLLLHGTCPRHNKDFVIRGSFTSVHENVAFPVEGALVEIYRDVRWAFDQRVGSTITGPDGGFEVRLWADDEDTYYAKLRLNDVAGVYLRDWWNGAIKDYNSFNRGSNSQPVIDVGETIITRDGGHGTPKVAVWQGGRAAYQEFSHTFNAPPPTGDYEIVNQNTVTGMTWTARSTTNYEEGTATYKYNNGAPIARSDPTFDPYLSQMINYSTNFHEFGHALRHTIDGDQTHFTNDASRWTYARKHGWCGSNLVDIEAFAFNEGWAEFWSMDTGADFQANCPSVSVADMTKEGAVMNDLHVVAQAIAACSPTIPDRAERFRAQRRNLYSILNRGGNLIHSEGEFRNNTMLQFPGCALPPVGVGIAASPLSIPSERRIVVPSDFATILPRRIEFYQFQSRQLAQELATALSSASEAVDCQTIPCETFVARIIRPIILRGHIRYLDLITKAFERRYREQSGRKYQSTEQSEEEIQKQQDYTEEFRRETLRIVLHTLTTSASALDKYAGRDTTGTVRESATELRRTARRLQLQTPPRNDELFTFFPVPTPPYDDSTSAGGSTPPVLHPRGH